MIFPSLPAPFGFVVWTFSWKPTNAGHFQAFARVPEVSPAAPLPGLHCSPHSSEGGPEVDLHLGLPWRRGAESWAFRDRVRFRSVAGTTHYQRRSLPPGPHQLLPPGRGRPDALPGFAELRRCGCSFRGESYRGAHPVGTISASFGEARAICEHLTRTQPWDLWIAPFNRYYR